MLICGFLIFAHDMYSRILFQGILPFGIAFLGAVAFVNFFSGGVSSDKIPLSPRSPNYVPDYSQGGGMSGRDYGSSAIDEKRESLVPETNSKGLKIISKPRPEYTESGRGNMVQGTIILRVAFLASGQIGGIQVVRGLLDGLTEQAVEAARRIRFEPATKNGLPISVTKHVEYTFTIY